MFSARNELKVGATRMFECAVLWVVT